MSWWSSWSSTLSLLQSLQRTLLGPCEHCTRAYCLAALAGVALIIYLVTNPSQQAENYYHETDKGLYYAMKVALLVLIIAVAVNAKYIAGLLLSTQAKRFARRFSKFAKPKPKPKPKPT